MTSRKDAKAPKKFTSIFMASKMETKDESNSINELDHWCSGGVYSLPLLHLF
jgi:hypothetical protein